MPHHIDIKSTNGFVVSAKFLRKLTHIANRHGDRRFDYLALLFSPVEMDALEITLMELRNLKLRFYRKGYGYLHREATEVDKLIDRCQELLKPFRHYCFRVTPFPDVLRLKLPVEVSCSDSLEDIFARHVHHLNSILEVGYEKVILSGFSIRMKAPVMRDDTSFLFCAGDSIVQFISEKETFISLFDVKSRSKPSTRLVIPNLLYTETATSGIVFVNRSLDRIIKDASPPRPNAGPSPSFEEFHRPIDVPYAFTVPEYLPFDFAIRPVSWLKDPPPQRFFISFHLTYFGTQCDPLPRETAHY